MSIDPAPTATDRAITGAVVAAVAIGLALAYATGYGANNQLTYLVEPLRRANPALFTRDWLVGTTTMYHPVFAWLVTPLYALDPRGATAFGVAQLVVMTATWLMIDRLLATVLPRARIPAFLLIAGLLALGGGRALAGSYLFAGYLQPSSLASLAWLGAMLAWVRDRPLATGLALAVAGAVHVNFLVLGIGLFAAVELSAGRFALRRLAVMLGPSLAVLAWFAPALLTGSGASDADAALRVLVEFSAPGHYKPGRVSRWLPPLVAWLAVAWAVRPLVRGNVGAVADRWWRFAAVGTAITVAAIAVAMVPPWLGVTRLFVPRIAPFAQLASQLLVVAAIVAPRATPATVSATWSSRRTLAVVLGAAVLIVEAVRLDGGPLTYAATLGLVAVAGLARSIGQRRVAIAVAIATCAFAFVRQRDVLRDPAVRWPECSGAGCTLARWAERETAVDAVFLIPPDLGWFRLFARRAIVVDTKSPPLYPDELVAWYRRLCDVVGVADAATHQQVEARWRTLDAAQLLAAARRFAADYVVLDTRESAARLTAPVAYEDSERVVYRVR